MRHRLLRKRLKSAEIKKHPSALATIAHAINGIDTVLRIIENELQVAIVMYQEFANPSAFHSRHGETEQRTQSPFGNSRMFARIDHDFIRLDVNENARLL